MSEFIHDSLINILYICPHDNELVFRVVIKHVVNVERAMNNTLPSASPPFRLSVRPPARPTDITSMSLFHR